MELVERFSIWLVSLNPTQGSEISKTRPCVVISPDVVNKSLNTVLVAPLTSKIKKYPTRVNSILQEKEGQIALDQIRAVDKSRLNKQLGRLDTKTSKEVCAVLQELFAW